MAYTVIDSDAHVIETPLTFEQELNSFRGAAFGLEPVLTQSAWFRPNNRSEDVRNRLIASGLWELPFGRGRLVSSQSSVVNQVIGGWSVSGLAEIHSGTALSPLDATNNTGSYSDGGRPNLVGNPSDLSTDRSKTAKVAQWFDTGAFAQNAAYTFGNAPRTFGRGPALVTSDLTLLKSVEKKSKLSL